MQILLESSNYSLANLGDMAMLQVCARRLRELWPDSRIRLLTRSPETVRRTFPEIEPIDIGKRHRWEILSGLYHSDNTVVAGAYRAADLALKNGLPGAAVGLLRARGRSEAASGLARYLEAIREASLIAVHGGGFFTDAFAAHATGILETLEHGQRMGKPTAILGVGFEEVRDRNLTAIARRVLPKVAVIGCREGLTSPGVLEGFGVTSDHYAVTGDDAIETAFTARTNAHSDGLGVNIRMAAYSGVEQLSIETLRSAIATAAQRVRAPLVALPISKEGPSDLESIRSLTEGYPGDVIGIDEPVETPAALLPRLSRCRAVVTGGYHSAVFALSQGIPVVALARSSHYHAKFGGLAWQFGAGCHIISLDDPALGETLPAAVEAAWESAEKVRELLLQAAQRQIEAGRSLYTRLREIV